MTGYSFQEVVGKNPRILKSGEMPPENYKRLWETITAGGEWRGEFHNRKKNGELYWESASISPIVDATGQITHFLAVKEDITERKRVENELRRAKCVIAPCSKICRKAAPIAGCFMKMTGPRTSCTSRSTRRLKI